MRVRITLLLPLLAAALAGCGSSHGSSGKAAYEHQMAAVAPSLQGELLKRRFALEESRVPAIARGLLLRTENELRAGIERVQAVKPPSEVASDQSELIAGYQGELAELKALEPLTHQASTDQFRVAAAKLSRGPGERKVAKALEAILAKGYDLGFPPDS